VPRLCGFYPGICLTTEEKARKNVIQDSHHQESSTVYTAIGIHVCHTGYADCLLAGSGYSILIPLASSQHNLYVYDKPNAVYTVLDS